MVPFFKPFSRIRSYFCINVCWALWQFYSKQTGENKEFNMEIWKVCKVLTFVHQLVLLLAASFLMASSSNFHPSSTGHMARIAASPVTSILGRKSLYSNITDYYLYEPKMYARNVGRSWMVNYCLTLDTSLTFLETSRFLQFSVGLQLPWLHICGEKKIF